MTRREYTSLTLKLRSRESAVTFVVAYGPTESNRNEGEKRAFWAALDGAVKEIPKKEQLFVRMDTKASV